MSHFYGTLKGGRGEATRCGTRNSGLTTYAAGWKGAIRVHVWNDEGVDRFQVSLEPWQGSGGRSRSLVSGHLNSDISSYKAQHAVETALNGIRFTLRALDSVKLEKSES